MRSIQLHSLLAILVGVSLGTSALAQAPTLVAWREAHLQADGSLSGQAAFPTQDGSTTTTANSGQLSLVRDGQVVGTTTIQQGGNFSFPSVQPGNYSIIGQGVNGPMTGVGATSIDVLPFDPTTTGSAFQMGLAPMSDANLLSTLQGATAPAAAVAGPASGVGAAAAGAGAAGGGLGGVGMLGGVLGAALGGLGAGMGSSSSTNTGSGGGTAISPSSP